jgi:CheY-specific phosphatase CheX
MSTAATLPEGPSRDFIRLWVESIASVLGQIAAVTFPMEDGALESAPAPAPNDLYLTFTAAGAIRGEMGLHLPHASALDLAKLFMGDTNAAHTELTADDRSASEELFRQIAGHVSTSARALWAEIPLTVVLRRSAHLGSGRGWLDALIVLCATADTD